MATQVASLYALLKLDDSDFKKGMQSAKSDLGGLGNTLSDVGGKVTKFGAGMTLATAPLAAALGLATTSAMNFDSAMTNVQAVMGKTDDQMKTINETVLAMGMNSVAGPQAVAEAFYDIVGGVSDASTHMDILSAAIATSEAGAADLGATTSALIAIMNSYKLSADEASYASDVLTRTVGMGVGTMDEFAAALPQVTGLANSLGISFGDLGAMTAYLTTQGNSASQATTQLAAMMTSLLNPNETMKDALHELGFESGEAAIKQLGLVGAFQAIAGTQTASTDGLAKITGSVEALRGVTSFAGDDFRYFLGTFRDGLTGATEAARNLQLDSAANQFNLLKSEMDGMAIEVGNVVLPQLVALAEDIKPVIAQVIDWMQKNPEATKTIVAMTGAVIVLGPLITALGVTISAAGTIISAATAIVGVFGTGLGALSAFANGAVVSVGALMGPVLAVTAAAVAAVAALKSVIDFSNQVGSAATQANAALNSINQTRTVTRAELEKRSFDAISGQYGGGPVGDIAARLFYSNVANSVQGDTQLQSGRVGNNGRGTNLGALAGRDTGGYGTAGVPYAIGTGAQPEVFVPSTPGNFYPNGGGMGGDMYIDTVTIIANDPASFEAQMRERRRMRG